jgi:hypothetical protein
MEKKKGEGINCLGILCVTNKNLLMMKKSVIRVFIAVCVKFWKRNSGNYPESA